MPAAPDELTAYAGLISMSDGTPGVGVMACYCGDLTKGERIVKPLRAFGSPLFDADSANAVSYDAEACR